MVIPESYVIQKLFSCAHNPTYHKTSNQYNAGCPICKEGRHLGRKKRLYYYTKTNSFYCFNCNKSWSAYTWIRDACNLTYQEIQDDIASNNYRIDITKDIYNSAPVYKSSETLPFDSINLSDPSQLLYYKDNVYVNSALSLISQRKLDTAVNRPASFFLSTKDYVHKNRICIPFYDSYNNIQYYQTRCLNGSHPKYLSKVNCEKKVYGINSINLDIDYIFIFEGPIDAMFVENGVAVTGLNISASQQQELDKFSFHKKIWVLDNQNVDEAAKTKTEKLLKSNSSVFIWPKNIKCKDFNELAIFLNQSSISHKFILNNTKKF